MSTNPTPGEITSVHSVIHWLLDNWQFTLFLLGSALGAVVWWMHSVFVSKSHMEDCRITMVENTDKKLDRHYLENKEEHKELRHDVKSILAHLLNKD